jgi:8-oxo-dGTP pyrophosphatase MutT (NUDIX family)
VTEVRVSLIDVYVLRLVPGAGGATPTLECLALQRGTGGRCPGSWETVHGHIEPGERPFEAALRELREETGLAAAKLYNLSKVEAFYQHGADAVDLVPVFAAFVDPAGPVALSGEHMRFEWLAFDDARARFAWPRERRALEDIEVMLAAGDAGAIEDVLRVS